MTRRSLRTNSRDRRNKLGWLYGSIGLLIISVIVVVSVYLFLNRRELDRTTGCPKDGYDTVTVALIDLTDQVSPVQAAALGNELLKIRDAVPRFGRLEIYPLASTTTHTIEPLFVGCNPGSGRDFKNPFFENPELADRNWKKQFGDKVEDVIKELQKIQQAGNSPILEGLQSVAVTAFGTPLSEHVSQRHVVLFSDMIHHTSDLSMYRNVPGFEDFKKTQYYARIRPSLRGANVDVFLIVRDTKVQQPPLFKFWVDLTAGGGGFLRHWKLLQ